MTCHCQHAALSHRYAHGVGNVGACLATGCACGAFMGGIGLEIRGNDVPTWENVASPQGALTPAGSDHQSLSENERG